MKYPLTGALPGQLSLTSAATEALVPRTMSFELPKLYATTKGRSQKGGRNLSRAVGDEFIEILDQAQSVSHQDGEGNHTRDREDRDHGGRHFRHRGHRGGRKHRHGH